MSIYLNEFFRNKANQYILSKTFRFKIYELLIKLTDERKDFDMDRLQSDISSCKECGEIPLFKRCKTCFDTGRFECKCGVKVPQFTSKDDNVLLWNELNRGDK